jgi:hypothetical protein
MPCNGLDVVHQAHFRTREAATIAARVKHHEVQMCCGWRVEYPPRGELSRVGHMPSALPISSSLIRTPISAAAYGAIAASSMRMLLEAQRGSHGGCFLCLDQVTLNRLMAARGLSEDLSGVVIRLAKAEAMASGRSSPFSSTLSPQAYAVSRDSPQFPDGTNLSLASRASAGEN